MGNVKSLLERSRDFEEAHCSCKELMEKQLQRIETYTTKWMWCFISAKRGKSYNLLFSDYIS